MIFNEYDDSNLYLFDLNVYFDLGLDNDSDFDELCYFMEPYSGFLGTYQRFPGPLEHGYAGKGAYDTVWLDLIIGVKRSIIYLLEILAMTWVLILIF